MADLEGEKFPPEERKKSDVCWQENRTNISLSLLSPCWNGRFMGLSENVYDLLSSPPMSVTARFKASVAADSQSIRGPPNSGVRSSRLFNVFALGKQFRQDISLRLNLTALLPPQPEHLAWPQSLI